MNYNIYSMKAALKVIPPILLCWPTTSNADVGGMAVEVEPSCQYSITLCCCVTDGSRGAVWRNGVWQKVNMMQRSVTEFLHVNKKGTCWHSSTLTECLWRTNSGCEHSEVVGSAFQQWQQWVTSAGADFYERSIQLLLIAGKNALLTMVMMLKNSDL